MGKFRTFDFVCEHCGRAEAEVLLDLNDEDPEAYKCECGELMTKQMSAPMVMNAAYPDGVRRHDPAFANAKAIVNLQVAGNNAKSMDTKKEIAREIVGRSKPVTKGGR